MASDESRKQWGTIFMGEREASMEQLDAMQEPMRRDKIRQEQTEDYMERVRKRAADRAREILGAAYTERLKVLDEARGDAEASKRAAARECQKLKAEGEALRGEAAEELEKARRIREEAEQIRDRAREEGLQQGLNAAGEEMKEFRTKLGQSFSRVILGLGEQRKKLLDDWREELCELTRSAAAAGAGFLLQKEHKAILNALVIQALHQLENRSSITVRVNPRDESTVVDMFQAARECVPDIRQWIVTPDDNIEPGGFIAESGAGRVDCRRQNFREMVDNILTHLTLPILESEEESARAMEDLVNEEAARIAALTPEEIPEVAEIIASEPVEANAQGPQEGSAPEDLSEAGQSPEILSQKAAEMADEAASLAGEALVGYNPEDIPLEDDESAEDAGAMAAGEMDAGEASDMRSAYEGGLDADMSADQDLPGAEGDALEDDLNPLPGMEEGGQPEDLNPLPDEEDGAMPSDLNPLQDEEDGAMPSDLNPADEDLQDAQAPQIPEDEQDEGGEGDQLAGNLAPANPSGQPTLAELEDELFAFDEQANEDKAGTGEKGA